MLEISEGGLEIDHRVSKKQFVYLFRVLLAKENIVGKYLVFVKIIKFKI